MENRIKTKREYFIIILVVGLINFGIFLINQVTHDIYGIFEPHFLIYWGIMLIMSFITGFFYIAIWLIIKSYFSIIKVDE